MNPCAGVVPTAYIEAHIIAPGGFDGFTDGCVTLLWVKGKTLGVLGGIAAAEVHFNEIKAAFIEIEVGIMLVIIVEAYIM